MRQRFPPATATPKAKPAETKSAPAEKKKKLSFKDQRELEAIPQKIQTLEAEREQISTRMAQADFYQQEKNQIGETQNRLAALEKELAAAYARWEALEAQG